MKKYIYQIATLGLLCVVFLTSSKLTFAQGKIAGEITVTPVSNSGGETFTTVNGERVVSGRSIFSPSEIATSPNAKAKVALADYGVILLQPNSKMNLFFNDSAVTGNVLSGGVTVEIAEGKGLNLQTPGGAVTKPAQSPYSVVVIDFVNGQTRVKTLTGQVSFNNTAIAAGQVFPAVPGQTDDDDNNNSTVLIALLVAAAVGGVLIGVMAAGNDESRPVSPVR